jgi:type II secretory pathway pseudopilin PulG
MLLKFNRTAIEEKPQISDQGFSIVETSIALVTLAICLAYAMPLFLFAKINNSNSETRTGALIVAQRVFDNIRSQSIANLPQNDGYNNPSAGVNPVLLPANINATISQADQLLTKAMGRQYQTKIIYCPGLVFTPASAGPPATPAIPADPTVCAANYRTFTVEVYKKDGTTKVYSLQGTYTDFQ